MFLPTKFDPEVFFAVDCSPAGDIYGNQGKVGDGTLIRFFDPNHIMLPNMKDFLLTTAEEAGIKYQYYCAAGGQMLVPLTCKILEYHQQLLVFVPVTFTRTKPYMLWMTS